MEESNRLIEVIAAAKMEQIVVHILDNTTHYLHPPCFLRAMRQGQMQSIGNISLIDSADLQGEHICEYCSTPLTELDEVAKHHYAVLEKKVAKHIPLNEYEGSPNQPTWAVKKAFNNLSGEVREVFDNIAEYRPKPIRSLQEAATSLAAIFLYGYPLDDEERQFDQEVFSSILHYCVRQTDWTAVHESLKAGKLADDADGLVEAAYQMLQDRHQATSLCDFVQAEVDAWMAGKKNAITTRYIHTLYNTLWPTVDWQNIMESIPGWSEAAAKPRTLKSLAGFFNLVLEPGDPPEELRDGERLFSYVATLTYEGRTETFGVLANGHGLHAYHVLDGVLWKAQVENCGPVEDENARKEWAAGFGWEPDSERARAAWRNGHETAEKLHRLLGEDYDVFASAAN